MPLFRAVDGITPVQSGKPKLARSPDVTVPDRRIASVSPAIPCVGVSAVIVVLLVIAVVVVVVAVVVVDVVVSITVLGSLN